MQSEEMNAKEFASEVGISAATMSNILAGRNKPSLEVMQKVLARFRMLNTEWLILGTGSMYRQKGEAQEPMLFDIRPIDPQPLDAATSVPAAVAPSKLPTEADKRVSVAPQVVERTVNRKVVKVVVFFEDGTYQELP